MGEDIRQVYGLSLHLAQEPRRLMERTGGVERRKFCKNINYYLKTNQLTA
jgi:hypothetical protein